MAESINSTGTRLNHTTSSPSRRAAALLRPALSTLGVAVALACSAGAHAQQAATSAGEEFASGRILIKARAGLPDAALSRILQQNGGGTARRVGRTDLRIVTLRPGQEKRLVERLKRHPHIEFAEVDRKVPLQSSNDPFFGSQWHLTKIGVPSAWNATDGSGVRIAILDTGVDGNHPDLKDRMVAGYNFYDGNTDTRDVHGHGTAVAGTAAATLNNGAGVASPAGRASIMPLRISAPDGYAYWSTVANALVWAADNGARVANVSYAVTGSSTVQSAANYMKSKGGLVVVSAGNNGRDEGLAATSAMITVSATDSGDNLTSWSSYGPMVDISAPGAGIYTTTNGGGYGSWNGTSFSSPLTAGVVAMMMSANPALAPADVERLLLSTALDLGTAGTDTRFGSGRVDAEAAVAAAASTATTADTTAPTVAIATPAGGSILSGLVAVDVSASDNKGVARVDLRVNGSTVASDSSAPFAFSWDSTKAANGGATLQAVAVDAAGNTGSSATVSVTVSNVVADTTAPAVTISNPADGARVSGTVGIRVSATDNSGSAGITQTLLINGKTITTVKGGSISFNWNTRRLTPGSYTIQAIARDAAGNSSSRSVTVTR